MRIRYPDGSSMRAEDVYESYVEQWCEQTPPENRTFESFCAAMKLGGFGWGKCWLQEQFDELDQGGVDLQHE